MPTMHTHTQDSFIEPSQYRPAMHTEGMTYGEWLKHMSLFHGEFQVRNGSRLKVIVSIVSGDNGDPLPQTEPLELAPGSTHIYSIPSSWDGHLKARVSVYYMRINGKPEYLCEKMQVRDGNCLHVFDYYLQTANLGLK